MRRSASVLSGCKPPRTGFLVTLGWCRKPDLQLFPVEPGHEKPCLMSYANNKGADQPAHPRSLISAFAVRCLDGIISLDSIAEISRTKLASVAAQVGLCLAGSETPEDTFCRVVAQLDDHPTSLYTTKHVYEGKQRAKL